MNKHGFYENNADNNQYFNFHSATDNFIPAHYHGSREMIFVKKGNVKVIVNGHEKRLRVEKLLYFTVLKCIISAEKRDRIFTY